MTNLLLKGAICAALLGVSVACTDGYSPYKPSSPDKGSISLKANVDKSLINGRSSRAEYTEIAPEDLSVRVTSEDGSLQQEFDKLEDLTADNEFPIGQYTVEVFYGSEEDEGYESPQFYGSQVITVNENQTTEVNISAELQNAILDVDYTDDFKNYMTFWDAEAQSVGHDPIDIPENEDRPVYTLEGTTTVSVSFTKPNGVSGKMQVASFNAVAKHYYHIVVGLNGGAGSASLTVSLDDTLAEEDIELDISDEVLNAPAPVISADGFDAAEPIVFVTGMPADEYAKVNVVAGAPLKSLRLTTTGTSLLSSDKGWPAEIDLLNASASERATLESLGFKAFGVFGKPDKLAALDFTGVLSHIDYIAGDDNRTTFNLIAVDSFGKESDPFTFSFEVQEFKMEITAGQAYMGYESVSIDFTMNAGDVNDVKVYVKIPQTGAFNEAKGVNITSLSRSAETSYRATFPVSECETFYVKLILNLLNPLESTEFKIDRVPLVIKNGDVNAFSCHAYIPVTIGSKDTDAALLASLMSNAKVYLSTDGTNFTAATTEVHADSKMLDVTGLAPNTTYTAKIRNGELPLDGAADFSFTTEAASQIPNGNLDAQVTETAKGTNWEQYQFEGWGTNNAMTTSQGGDFAYVRISGTIPTDGKAGNGVLLRTCGWGSGNTATGSSGTSGKCKYTDAGLLHLGSERSSRPSGYGSTGPVSTDELTCGIDFASRPASISFWYKYFPKNPADKGYAEVWIKDDKGNKFITASMNLDAVSEYTQKTFTFNYPLDSYTKAAKLYVKFLSSYSEEYINRTDDNFSGPGFVGNLGKGTFMGSQLYIDEVTLNY